MKKITVFAVAALITASAVSTSHAIGGLGFHWGFDLSMSMKNVLDEAVKIPEGFSFDLTVPDFDIDGLPLPKDVAVPEGMEYLMVSRTKWNRSAINFGGKLFVDAIRFFDVEASFNLGVWQYEGVVNYLNADMSDADNVEGLLDGGGPVFDYKPMRMTLDEFGMSYFGLKGTPYAKLQFDATVRKQVINLWLVKFSAGAGMSLHFSTPLLSGALIEEVEMTKGVSMSPEDLVKEFSNPKSDIGKKVVNKILDELMTPRYGAHIVAGAKLKLPVMPLGIYIDGKFMIPFSKFDENKTINGFGFLINTGLSLSI